VPGTSFDRRCYGATSNLRGALRAAQKAACRRRLGEWNLARRSTLPRSRSPALSNLDACLSPVPYGKKSVTQMGNMRQLELTSLGAAPVTDEPAIFSHRTNRLPSGPCT